MCAGQVAHSRCPSLCECISGMVTSSLFSVELLLFESTVLFVILWKIIACIHIFTPLLIPPLPLWQPQAVLCICELVSIYVYFKDRAVPFELFISFSLSCCFVNF